jgi:hypothetical protein
VCNGVLAVDSDGNLGVSPVSPHLSFISAQSRFPHFPDHACYTRHQGFSKNLVLFSYVNPAV